MKQRDKVAMYRDAGRDELAESELAEEVLKEFLPSSCHDEVLSVEENGELGVAHVKDMTRMDCADKRSLEHKPMEALIIKW